MRLVVRLTPRGGRDAIDGWASDESGRPYLKVRVRAAPIEGAANAALIAFLAKALGLPKSAFALAAGQGSRLKALEVTGLDPAVLAAAAGAKPLAPR